MTENDSSAPAASAASAQPTALGLATVTALGAIHAGWALFQWTQLVAARTGGESFCGLGEDGACTAVWDSPLASTIQGISGLPIAGWGLVWSLAAFGLPLWALTERAAARPGWPAVWPATLITALAGAAATIGLLAISLVEGRICTTCAITYGIVFAYTGICCFQTPLRSAELFRGVSLAAGSVALAYVLLFIPGLRTPLSKAVEGQQILDRLAAESARGAEAASERAPAAADMNGRVQTDEEVTAAITTMLEQLSPELKQDFSNALDAYASAPEIPLQPPRTLKGDANAPLRLTEFTDVLCGHCASLHETIDRLKTALPLRAFSVEPRQFPLDPGCNPELAGPPVNPVRCIAARAAICLEGEPDFEDFAGSLYLNQRTLTEEKIYALAAPIMPEEALRACMSDPITEAHLRSDIAWAAEHDIKGTPLVLLNGREVAPFGPLLYALILSGGDANHPAFENLPEPKLEVSNPHAGHDHRSDEGADR